IIAESQRDEARIQRARAEVLLHIVHAYVDEFSNTFTEGKIRAVMTNDPGALPYGLARYYARASAAYGREPGLSVRDRTELATQCADRAVRLLMLADDLGYFRNQPSKRIALLIEDKDMAALRSLPAFTKLLAELKANAKGH